MKALRIWIVAALLGSWLTAALAPVAQAVIPPVTNFGKVTVSGGYNSSATSIVLLSGHGSKLPASGFPFPMSWWDCSTYGAPEDDPFVEIVSVTNRSADTLTVVRAQEGTSASNHNTGGNTYCMVLAITKGIIDAIRADIAAAAGGASHLFYGANDPNGAVTGSRGDIYGRNNGGQNTTLYTKETGDATNTGWVPLITVPDWAAPNAIGSGTPAPGTFTTLTGTRLNTKSWSPTVGSTVTIDVSLGTFATITVTNNSALTIAAPTNGNLDDDLFIRVKNTSGGVMATPTWDTVYKMATFTKPQNGTYRVVHFKKISTSWIEVACSPEIPNEP